MHKGPLIIGSLVGLGALAWAAAGRAQPAPGLRSVVTTSVKVRRGVRERWRGAVYPPPPELDPRPKYKPGQAVTINDKDEPPGSPVQGKTTSVKELIYYEPVAYGPGGVATPLPERGSWGYVTNLTVDGQPVIVAETSLYSGAGAAKVGGYHVSDANRGMSALDEFLRANSFGSMRADRGPNAGGSYDVRLKVSKAQTYYVQGKELNQEQMFALAKLAAKKFTAAYGYDVNVQWDDGFSGG